jgi:hypothetical protein
MQRVDLAVLSRDRTLSPNHAIDVSYALNDGTLVKARLLLSETATAFGGRRLWLHCPSCGRRCRVIYAGRRRFACRSCHRVRYSSQAEAPEHRANRGMLKIVKRLDPGATHNDLPPKPKGMHWHTYERLECRYDVYVSVIDARLLRALGRLMARC